MISFTISRISYIRSILKLLAWTNSLTCRLISFQTKVEAVPKYSQFEFVSVNFERIGINASGLQLTLLQTGDHDDTIQVSGLILKACYDSCKLYLICVSFYLLCFILCVSIFVIPTIRSISMPFNASHIMLKITITLAHSTF